MVYFYLRTGTFLFGVLLGVLIARVCVYRDNERLNVPVKKQIPSYETWSTSQGLKRKQVYWDFLRYGNSTSYLLESEVLFRKIKVLCIIFVESEKNIDSAKNTWAHTCNNLQLIEIKTKKNKYLSLKRTKDNSSWVKLCQLLRKLTLQYDWYLIVKDTTFVILENLRHFVASFNSTENYYLGHPVKFWSTVYNLGQAGYVLSKGALKAVQSSLSETECSTITYWNREDFYLGKHLSKLNIIPRDTRDAEGYTTFHPYNWFITFFPGGRNNYYSSIHPIKCCSKQSISFQAIEGSKMYTYYYLLYTLQIFSFGNFGNRKNILNISDDEIWKSFLKERHISIDNVTSQEYYEVWRKLIEDPRSFAAHMKKEVNLDYE